MSEIGASRRNYGEVTINHLLDNDCLRFFFCARVMCFALLSRAEPYEPKPEFKLNSWPSNGEIIYSSVFEQVKTVQRPYENRGWNPNSSPFRVANLVLGSGSDVRELVTLEQEYIEKIAKVNFYGDPSDTVDMRGGDSAKNFGLGIVTHQTFLLLHYFGDTYRKILENANSPEVTSLIR